MEREPKRLSIEPMGQDYAADICRLQPRLCVCVPLARSRGRGSNREGMVLMLRRGDASTTGARGSRGHAPGGGWGTVHTDDSRSILVCGEEEGRESGTRGWLRRGIWGEMDGRGRRGEWLLLSDEWNARLSMAAPVLEIVNTPIQASQAMSTDRIQVIRRAVPRSLAAAAPVVRRFAADGAWMRDDGTSEMGHDGEGKRAKDERSDGQRDLE